MNIEKINVQSNPHEPSRNWLKGQFENGTPERTNEEASVFGLNPADWHREGACAVLRHSH